MAPIGISKNKMWRLVKSGDLKAIPNPLDGRQKLLRRAEVERLQKYSKSTAPSKTESKEA